MHGLRDSYPLKLPLFSSDMSQVKSYEPKALNETILPVSLFYTPSRGSHQFPSPLKPKRKNGDMRKRGDPHQEQEKVNKGKNRKKVKRKKNN